MDLECYYGGTEEGIGKLRDLILTTVCVCANVHTHTCNSARGSTKCGPPLRVHYLLVLIVSVVCIAACMCGVCHALLVFTLVSL